MTANAYARAVSANADYQRRLELRFSAIDRRAAHKLCDLNMQKDSMVGELVRIGTKTPDLRDYDHKRKLRNIRSAVIQSAKSKKDETSVNFRKRKGRKSPHRKVVDLFSSSESDTDTDTESDEIDNVKQANRKAPNLKERLDLFLTSETELVHQELNVNQSEATGVRSRKSTAVPLEKPKLNTEMQTKYVNPTVMRKIDRAKEICRHLEVIQDKRERYLMAKESADKETPINVRNPLAKSTRGVRCSCYARKGIAINFGWKGSSTKYDLH